MCADDMVSLTVAGNLLRMLAVRQVGRCVTSATCSLFSGFPSQSAIASLPVLAEATMCRERCTERVVASTIRFRFQSPQTHAQQEPLWCMAVEWLWLFHCCG